MLFAKMAWKNIWRNKRRTCITLAVMIFCISIVIISICMAIGFYAGIINNSIKAGTGHIQIHKHRFHAMVNSKYYLKPDEMLFKALESDNRIRNYSLRIKGSGLVNHTSKSQNVTIIGIQPDKEPNISVFHKKPGKKTRGPLIKGDYLNDSDWREGMDKDTGVFHIPGLLLGYKTAEKFKAKIGTKVVVVLQSLTGEIKRHLFQVRGIYRTLLPAYDRGAVLIHYKIAQKLFDYSEKGYFSEVAVIVRNYEDMHPVAESLKTKLQHQDVEVLTWDEIHPNLLQFIALDRFYATFSVGILFVITAIGVVITLLMSIFERVREFGVMRSLGMTNAKLIALIMTESFWLALISSIAGLIIALPISYYYQVEGIDFSQFMAGADLWAMSLDTTVYMRVKAIPVMLCIGFTIFLTLLVSLYPGIKATRTQIVDALTFV